MMRNAAIAIVMLGAAVSAPAMAQSNTALGVGTGAVTGAIVAGPIGAIVGAVAGGYIGARTEPRRRYVRYYNRKRVATRRYYSAH